MREFYYINIYLPILVLDGVFQKLLHGRNLLNFTLKLFAMSFHLIDMVLSGLAYVIMTYFIMKMIKHRTGKSGGNDEDDGGKPVQLLPDLDLPPGISLPIDKPPVKSKEPEEALA